MIELDRQFGKISLTDRERDILRLLTSGLTDGEIAEALILTVGTVKWYNRQIYNKLGVRNRTEAVTQAQSIGLLEEKSNTEPALRALPTHNLPAQVTSFVGRSAELTEVKRLLGISRLVTLTGAPGTGKTRLAIQAAMELMQSFTDGVFLASLAPIRDPGLVATIVCQALGVVERGSESGMTILKDHLRDKYLLLILDNFEHLLPAASLVADLLNAAPRLIVLTTSREALQLYGEQEFLVPPLATPDLRQQLPIHSLLSFEAVDLFVQRAQAAAPSFALTNENATAVATICSHLDGLPLAIELAAARTKLYAPTTLLVRLASRLDTLNEGPRNLPAHQKTLRDTLAWSYTLLDEEEKLLMARLGVFAGGCTFETVQAVCDDDMVSQSTERLESLFNKSLLRQVMGQDGAPRFIMLETVREYALEQLEKYGETELIHRRHMEYFLAMAEQGAKVYGSNVSQQLAWYDAEHNNLLAAMRWNLLASADDDLSFRLIASLAWFWIVRGYLSEGRVWLREVMSINQSTSRTKARADALRGVGDIAYLQSDYEASRALHQEALAIYQELNDRWGIANTLIGLGDTASEIGDYPAAIPLLEEANAIMNELGHVMGRGRASTLLGWGALRQGNYTQGRRWLEQALALYQQANDDMGIALVTSGLGEIALREDHLDQAAPLLENSYKLRQKMGEKWGIAVSLGTLAWLALRQGNVEHASSLLKESLTARMEIGHKGGCAWCLEKFAEIAQLTRDWGRAARLYGAAASIRESAASVVDPVDLPEYKANIKKIRDKLDYRIFEVVWEEGQKMNLDQATKYACSQ